MADRARVRKWLADLHRRRVLRVAAGYLVIAWAAIEVSTTTFPLANLPDWTPRLVLVLALLGLPVALVLAWAYDVTPDGVRRTDSSTSAEHWQRAQALLAAALELPEIEHDEYVRRAVRSDPALRKDVESLLRAHRQAGFLDRPAAEWAQPLFTEAVHAEPRPGTRVGQYEILAKLGGGGMGVIYRARDSRLGRIVALKFLPPHLSHDLAAKERFMVEARAVAALDHPHICTLLEIGEALDGQMFLAMPHYEGETLNRRLSRGPLPVSEALDLAAQAASGLAAAHAKGIVHRDIKPANLMVTTDGVVKILDFGIAKLADVIATRPDVTPGTLAYMSPEQARGEPVDARSDVWSLGVVLYEALAGRRPFTGGTDELILAAIRRADPAPLSSLRADLPDGASAVIRRALAGASGDRYSGGAEMHGALVATLGETAIVAGPVVASGPDSAPAATATELTPEGERRQATVVVSTVGGYAALVETLTPDEIRAVIGRVRAAAEEVAARFGGIVNGFDDDRLELLFGVPTSHEDHCFRAVRAALELHERVRGIEAVTSQGMGAALVLQSGVDTGQVVARPATEGTRFRLVAGPARTAARLHGRSGPDELWITPACQRMVGPFFETQPGEPLSLGDDGAVLIPHRVLRLSGLRTSMEAAQRVGLTRYVGRERELAALRGAVDAARAGNGRLVTVVGDAGMGKSRLLHELHQILTEAEEVMVLEGRCQSHGRAVAYLPFVEVLRTVVGAGAGTGQPAMRADAVAEAILALGDELEAFLPLYLHLLSLSHPEHPLPTHLNGEALRRMIEEAVAALLTLLTRQSPMAILLEDWHWADDASHAVLEQVAELAPGHRLLLVVTARSGVADWGNPPEHTAVALGPLDRSASADMLRSVLHAADLPEPLADRIHERTAGNPFFIEEIGRALVEEGALRVQAGGVVMVGSLEMLHIPHRVEAVIRARFDRLDRETREVARLASVIGREFERMLLEEAMEGRSHLPHAIQALKSAGLVQQVRVVPDAAYRFNHVLTQEVAYASLLERQRVELHGRVAESIERSHEGPLDEYYDRLAQHFSEAAVWSKAVHYGVRAAERLENLSAFPDALQQLERCERWITSLDDPGTASALLVDVLLRQERVCETLGLRARQQQIIDRLVALLEGTDDRAGLAEVYVRQGDLYTLLRRFEEAERVLLEALRLRREMDHPVGIRNALRSLGLLYWHSDRSGEALDLIEETLAIDRERGNAEAIVGDLSNLGAVLKSVGELSRARSALEEALRVVEEHSGRDDRGPGGLRLGLGHVLHNLGNVYRELGEPDIALEYLSRAHQHIERHRLPIQLSYTLTSIAHVCLRQGRVEESLQYYEEAVDASRRARFRPGLAQALRMLGEVLIGLGRERDAVPYLDEAAVLFAQLEDRAGAAGIWRDLARAHERLGASADALQSWRRAAELHASLDDAEAEVEALEGLARTTRRAGADPDDAVRVHREALRRAEAVGAHEVQGRLLNALGIIEWERNNHDAALRWYEAGLHIFRQIGDTGGAGLMLNSLGVTLKSIGRRDDARQRLEEALTVHRSAGNKVLEGHAFAALGDLAIEDGEPDRALWLFTESLGLREESGDRAGEGWMHSRLAATQAARGRTDLATKHAAAARRLADELGDAELAATCEHLPTTAALP